MIVLSKALEATGLVVIGAGFFAKFPALMNPKLFMAGMALFAVGWLIERFLVKK